MPLQAIHATIDEIPETYRELYTERGGRFELSGIQGVKTEADVTRVHDSLVKERDAHKVTRDRLRPWGDLVFEDVQASLDRIPELEAAATGAIDEEKMAQLVDAKSRTLLAPVERQLQARDAELLAVTEERDNLIASRDTRTIQDSVRGAFAEAKIIDPGAQEDILSLSSGIFEIREDDNTVVTKDGVGVTPGISAADYFAEMQPKRPGWWFNPTTQGGGAGGSQGGGGGPANNPWSATSWNATNQGKYVREHGAEKARQAATSVGSSVGSPHPPKPKA